MLFYMRGLIYDENNCVNRELSTCNSHMWLRSLCSNSP